MPATIDRSLVTANQLIVATYVVPGPDRITVSHYELHLAPDDSADAPRTVLLTRDDNAFVLASLAEAEGARVTARWHRAVRGGIRACVLDALETAQ